MQDISKLSKSDKEEIAGYIKRDNLPTVNKSVKEVHPKSSFYVQYGKRICDILIAFVALIVTFPINLLIGVVTFFDVGRPIFFVQQRIGKDGKPFKIVKFRNMTNDTDENGEQVESPKMTYGWDNFQVSVYAATKEEVAEYKGILERCRSGISIHRRLGRHRRMCIAKA